MDTDDFVGRWQIHNVQPRGRPIETTWPVPDDTGAVVGEDYRFPTGGMSVMPGATMQVDTLVKQGHVVSPGPSFGPTETERAA
jgi:hypothetical protein